jgi:hypothetical protein
MTKLFQWIYQDQNQKWSIYLNGKTFPSIKTKDDAIERAKKIAKETAQETNCLVDILLQRQDGSIELMETYGKVFSI